MTPPADQLNQAPTIDRPHRQQLHPSAYLHSDSSSDPFGASGSLGWLGRQPLLQQDGTQQATSQHGWLILGSMAHSSSSLQQSGRAAPANAEAAAARTATAVTSAGAEAAAAAAAATRLVTDLHTAARSAKGSASSSRGGSAWRSSVELLRPQLQHLQPDQLADLAWALSRLNVRPDDAWLRDLCATARARFPLRRFRGYTFATLLPALAALRCAPGASWLGACLEAMTPKLASMWPRELASVAAALPPLLRALPARAVAQLLARSGWACAFWAASSRFLAGAQKPGGGKLPVFEPIGLARTLHAVAQLSAEQVELSVPAEWLSLVAGRLAEAADDGQLRPQEITMTSRALVLLRQQGRRAQQLWQQQLQLGQEREQQDEQRQAEQRGQQQLVPPVEVQANGALGRALETLPGLAALQQALERAVAAQAHAFGPVELSGSLLALANLGRQPDWPWLHAVLSAGQVRMRVVPHLGVAIACTCPV